MRSGDKSEQRDEQKEAMSHTGANRKSPPPIVGFGQLVAISHKSGARLVPPPTPCRR